MKLSLYNRPPVRPVAARYGRWRTYIAERAVCALKWAVRLSNRILTLVFAAYMATVIFVILGVLTVCFVKLVFTLVTMLGV